MSEGMGTACFALGTLFTGLAALGVLRLPDVLCRCHALTKAATVGITFIFLGMGFRLGFSGATGLKIVIAIAFQWITIPISGHLLARLAYRRHLRLSPQTFRDPKP